MCSEDAMPAELNLLQDKILIGSTFSNTDDKNLLTSLPVIAGLRTVAVGIAS